MIKLVLFIVVVVLLFILIQIISEANKDDEDNNVEMEDEYELEKIGESIENFTVEDGDDIIIEEKKFDISKEDYEKIRNDNFNDQFFNFNNRLHNSSDNVDNSVERVNRFRNSKFGLTEESASGMRIRDVSDYFISH